MERTANWPAAHVDATDEGYVLKVPIEGDPSSDWDDAFRRAVEARRHEVWGGQWGHVRHRPDEICVEQVSEGSEQPLKEFLEACLREADVRMRQEEADRREDQAALEHKRTESSYGFDPTGDRNVAVAQRMTERFR